MRSCLEVLFALEFSFFFPKFQDTPEEALDWSRNFLNCYDLLLPHKCLLEELWIPINLGNQHWILVTVDFVHGTYFAINPIHPTTQQYKKY